MTHEELFRAKQLLIDQKEKALLKTANAFERKLLDAIFKDVISQLGRDKGEITDSRKNILLTQAVDKIFDEFENNEGRQVASQLYQDFVDIHTTSSQYFELFKLKSAKQYAIIRTQVKDKMRERIGLDAKGKIVSGGFLDNFIRSTSLRNDIKDTVLRSVASGRPIGELVKYLQVKISGAPGIDGSLTRYYKGFAFDSYQQYDRSTNALFAKRLSLRCFVYAGGIIDDSRAFCITKNGKVFTTDETLKWVNDPTLPKTKAENVSGILIYSPLDDMGRWNCRHTPRFITDEQAIRLRPELASVLRVAA